MLIGLALALGGPAMAGAQTLTCGNAFYDDGAPVMAREGNAGDPDHLFGVRFELEDFGYQPGRVEITGFCASNLVYYFSHLSPNQVFIYPDVAGRPDDSTVLGQGTIHGNSDPEASIVMLDDPVLLHGDFWLVARGDARFAGGEMGMDADALPDGGHSYFSHTGIEDLAPVSQAPLAGDFCLRAYLQPAKWSYQTAGISHSSGAHGSQWRSKLAVLNTADAANQATLRYHYGSSTAEVTVQLGPGELRTWDDVVVDLFGVAVESSGAIKVRADEPVLVSARTYNASAAGTFGQYMPAVREADALSFGQLGRLSLLSNSDTFRSNIGFLNLGSERAELRVTLHDATGTALGSLEIAVPAGRWRQQSDVFGAVGAGEVANGYATVELLTEGGRIWSYASVIDNATGDPTTVPLAIE
ncbi:MAG TPA: hypothetical protein PLS95_19000 [Thermoanaerobaculales bacterium]|nr:hypothetical protein [Thermoanaerobaculales bacterium]HQN96089.1 hypothetical protein [Thermoanaerobaculales bacterium]